MSELVRWESDAGPVLVEVAEKPTGMRQVSRGADGVAEARGRFEEAFEHVRDAAQGALATFATGALRPDTIELEFGVKLNASAGAVFAKTAAEAHFKVKLSWLSDRAVEAGRTTPPEEPGDEGGEPRG